MAEDCLNERTRAEDVLLGSLGFDSDARIVEVRIEGSQFVGIAEWSDGDRFSFESEDELTELEIWAVGVLTGCIPHEKAG